VNRCPFGLALSGGTAKSVAHVGILKALAEDGIRVDHIAGTSGGSILAVLYASGMPVSTMEELALEMSWKKLMSVTISRLGFISSAKIQEFIKEAVGDISFEELKIPCSVIATDLETGEKRVFNSGKVAVAVRASCSIPQIYLPVEIDGRNYIDGGFCEYLGIETLREQGGNLFAVGSHLGSTHSRYMRPRHMLHLIMQLTNIMAKKNYLISEQKADFLIHPDLDEFSSFDFDNARTLIDIGYSEAGLALAELHRAWKRKSGWRSRLFG
jgi:NTE family protein